MPPPTASTPALMADLQAWRSAGWLRRLDLAFARFIHQLDPAAPPSLLLASALLAQLEGRGHSCLPLATLRQHAVAWLGWPADARAALQAALQQLPGDAASARSAWAAQPVLQTDPSDDQGATPLVLVADRLYLRRYWRFERSVARQVLARTATAPAWPIATADHRADTGAGPTSAGATVASRNGQASTGGPGPAVTAAPRRAIDTNPAVDTALARSWLDRLFPPPSSPAVAAQPDTTDWQKLACALALRGRFTVITGGPGTGKTHTAARLLVLLQALHRGAQPLRVALAAPTGKAAARLRQAIARALAGLRSELVDGPGASSSNPLAHDHAELLDRAAQVAQAGTLHALLGARPDTRRLRHHAGNPLALDLLFVDEASMVHLEMMASLLEALAPDTRVVLLGDKDQLASVEAGAVLGDLCQGAGRWRPDTLAWARALTGQTPPADDEPVENLAADADLAPSPAPAPAPATATATATATTTTTTASASATAAATATAAAATSITTVPTDLQQQTVVLRHSHRFAGAIGQLALAVNAGDRPAALRALRASAPLPSVRPVAVQASLFDDDDGGAGVRPLGLPAASAAGQPLAWFDAPDGHTLDHLALHGRPGAEGGYAPYLHLLRQGPEPIDSPTPDPARHDAWARRVLQAFDRCRVLCALRDGPWGVAGLNARIVATLRQAGLLPGRGEWYEGRPVMVTRNDAALGVFNGDIGIVLRSPVPGGPLRVWFLDGDAVRSVAASRLADVETAFAMTVHKSQGSEFDHVVLVLPDQDSTVLSRELVYTGITRARHAFTLVATGDQVLAAALARRTQRASGLQAMLAAMPVDQALAGGGMS